MFRVIDPLLPIRVASLSGIAVVDIQLVGDDLASNPIFTIDKSRPKVGHENVLTYSSLTHTIPKEQLLGVRRLVARLLKKLHEDKPFLCFVTGQAVPAEVLQGFSVQFHVIANCDDVETKGRVSLLRVDPDEVEESVQGFGHFDSLRWLALANWDRDLRRLLSALRLTDLVPSTDEGLYFQRPGFLALGAALEHGEFFFEEVNNGTRLRIATTRMPRSELMERVGRLISDSE